MRIPAAPFSYMVSNIHFGWKAVHRTSNRHLYSFGHAARDGRSLRYKIGDWTRPESGDGPLAVFRSYKAANNFSCFGWVYPCKFIESKRKKLWSIHNHEKIKCDYPIPRGTAYADMVMLGAYHSRERR